MPQSQEKFWWKDCYSKLQFGWGVHNTRGYRNETFDQNWLKRHDLHDLIIYVCTKPLSTFFVISELHCCMERNDKKDCFQEERRFMLIRHNELFTWDIIWYIKLFQLTSYGRTIGYKSPGGCHSGNKVYNLKLELTVWALSNSGKHNDN